MQNAVKAIPSKRPKNYKNMTEDYFKEIEESELVTCAEARAYHYHQCKKSDKWIYIILAIIAALIAYKLLL